MTWRTSATSPASGWRWRSTSAAAMATKFSSLAGPAAAATYLLSRHGWRLALQLLGPFAVLCLAGVAALHLGTDGRFLDNFRSLGGGGMTADHLRLGPARLGLA